MTAPILTEFGSRVDTNTAKNFVCRATIARLRLPGASHYPGSLWERVAEQWTKPIEGDE